MPLSLILIVKNEERDLPACLESAKDTAEETVVVDTGSTDKTREIALQFGARVVDEPWTGDFSKARNRAIAEAKGPFILWLDADDRLPPESVPAIRALASSAPDAAHALVVENRVDGRSGPVFRQVRLFPKRDGVQFEGRIHESLAPSLIRAGLPIHKSGIIILHTGYDKPGERSAKTDRNLKLLEEEVRAQPSEPAVLFALGNSYYQKKKYDAAIAAYLRAEAVPKVDKIQPDLYRELPSLLGTAYYEKGEDGPAVQWFKKGVERSPRQLTPYYFLGKIALRRNDPATVLQMFRKVIELEPEVTTIATDNAGMKANAYAFAANLLFGRGQFGEALQLFSEADAKFPRAAFAYGPAAEAALRTENFEKAIYFFKKGEAAGDLSSSEWSDYGVLLWASGARGPATGCFEKALALDPRNADALANLEEAKK